MKKIIMVVLLSLLSSNLQAWQRAVPIPKLIPSSDPKILSITTKRGDPTTYLMSGAAGCGQLSASFSLDRKVHSPSYKTDYGVRAVDIYYVNVHVDHESQSCGLIKGPMSYEQGFFTMAQVAQFLRDTEGVNGLSLIVLQLPAIASLIGL